MATAAGPSFTTDVEAFKKGVRDSIKFKYATLKGALEGSMESFAGEMYQVGLINGEAMKSHKYDVIMSQFISGMGFKHTISELQKHCQLFTDVLERLDGPPKMASSDFSTEWTTLISQQQYLVIRREVTVTEAHNQQGMLILFCI